MHDRIGHDSVRHHTANSHTNMSPTVSKSPTGLDRLPGCTVRNTRGISYVVNIPIGAQSSARCHLFQLAGTVTLRFTLYRAPLSPI